MPCSPAKLEANRRNALKSTGPRTDEGKERCRGNALKHGLTGRGVVLPVEDETAVEERFVGFEEELGVEGEVGRCLARRAALLSVPGTSLHLYGKSEARLGRKMGHVTVVAPTSDEARRRAFAVAPLIRQQP